MRIFLDFQTLPIYNHYSPHGDPQVMTQIPDRSKSRVSSTVWPLYGVCLTPHSLFYTDCSQPVGAANVVGRFSPVSKHNDVLILDIVVIIFFILFTCAIHFFGLLIASDLQTRPQILKPIRIPTLKNFFVFGLCISRKSNLFPEFSPYLKWFIVRRWEFSIWSFKSDCFKNHSNDHSGAK